MKKLKFDIDFTIEIVRKKKVGSLSGIDLFKENLMESIYILKDNIVTKVHRIKNLITKRD